LNNKNADTGGRKSTGNISVTENVQPYQPLPVNEVRFSVAAHAAWAPGLETPAAWQAWADADTPVRSADYGREPAVSAMPAMLRRRASPPGKMALQAAYDALANAEHTARTESRGSAVIPAQPFPVVFCSRHGECGRSAELLSDLARHTPLSPTAFSLSVHNASGGLFSIARKDHANSLALAAGHSTIEHAVIEACGLLADGAPAVLLVAADGLLPPMYTNFADCNEQPFGWSWLVRAAGPGENAISLCWSRSDTEDENLLHAEPGGMQVMRFFLRGDACLQRSAERRNWIWRRHV
jgi:hypothetical protein